MVKTWTRHKTAEAVLNNGWRLALVLGVVGVNFVGG